MDSLIMFLLSVSILFNICAWVIIRTQSRNNEAWAKMNTGIEKHRREVLCSSEG